MSEAPRGPQFDAQPTPEEGEGDHAELLAMFDRWEKDLTAHWSGWQQESREAYDFVAGHQWSEDDRVTMEEHQKVPVVFNLTAPTIDAVCGAEIQNRQQVQYYPREVGDTGVADALTQGAEYISDECNGDQEDSEAFRDALVCGVGWTETRPEVDGDQVCIIKERVDPLQMRADPASRKACFEDARYICREIPMSQDAFEDFREEIGRPDAEGDDAGLGPGKRLTVVDPRVRYTNGMLGTGEEDEVIVCEWQWWKREPVHLVGIPQQDGTTKITPLDDEALQQVLAVAPDLQHTASTRKVYYRAIVGGGEVLLYEQLKENAFRYKSITGKRDRNKGVWYGLVRPMIDPNRLANKLYSEILHAIRTGAKGGLMAEEGAVKDIEQFEETWAQSDAITWVKDGSISSGRIQPKQPPLIPPQVFQLMEWARDMVRACTGVNEEILGLVSREQAGVLEHQRKQAAYGILSPFFDAERRYRRDQGRLLLAMMRLYLPEDKLVRLVDKGTAQYVPLARTLEAEEYDIVVDEAPTGPNAKSKINAVLQPLIPALLEGQLIGAEEVADAVQYLDLPASVANKLADGIRKKAESSQPDPQMQEIQQRGAIAEIENKEADTEKKRADAFKTATDAHLSHAQAAEAVMAQPEPEEEAMI